MPKNTKDFNGYDFRDIQTRKRMKYIMITDGDLDLNGAYAFNCPECGEMQLAGLPHSPTLDSFDDRGSNLDPTWGIERLISGHGYKCRLCGSRPARLVVRLWEDGFRTRVPLCDVHLQASIAAFKQNTLDAATAARRQPRLAPAEPDVPFDSTATGQRIADEDSRPLIAPEED